MNQIYSLGYANSLYKPFKLKEKDFNIILNNKNYYVLRFDGKDMTAGFKIKHKAINEVFFNTMKDTFNEFCQSYRFILFGYCFSDEISILIKATQNAHADHNRIEKLLSLMSSKLSLIFYRNAQKNNLNLKNKDWVFDSRIIKLETNQINNYFLARQAFAIDKYIMQLKGEYKIDYTLNKSNQVIEELKNKNINYEDLPKEYRYGLMNLKGEEITPFEINENINFITQQLDI